MAIKTAAPGLPCRDLNRQMSLTTGDEKHRSAATSTLDALWVPHHRVLRVTPATVDDPEPDRLLLSKGHGPMAYYAVLVADGFFDEAPLPGFGGYDSPPGHDPDRLLGPGAEIGSGSLRHGLPPTAGSVPGLRAQGLTDPRAWILVGDAELDEGSNREATAHAGPAGLDQLHTLVIDNASEAAGWSVRTVDGRDHEALYAACTARHPGRPHTVIAHVAPKS
ncbi:transketolase [Streptomyces sp900116325]|uniref:transketolase n=1 Tax=Streptomyces sp. 900116325 TaxID=3154295 RepID=UPI0033BCEDCE